MFAIAFTSRTGFKGVENSQTGRFSLSYEIQGGSNDGKTFNIGMKRCASADWTNFHLEKSISAREASIIQVHRQNDAFYCPDAFDLSFWGMKGDLDSKTISLRFDYI